MTVLIDSWVGKSEELDVNNVDLAFEKGFASSSEPSVQVHATEKPWRNVIEWQGDQKVKVWATEMEVGVPYGHTLFGVPVVAIKRPSGEVHFYQVPRAD